MADYQISTLAQLQAMSSHLADDCVLMNNIDASATRTWNAVSGFPGEYYGFLPITEFTGTFDGGGYTISNLYINRGQATLAPGYTYIGLFGSVVWTGKQSNFIKDVTLKDIDISGKVYVGGLIARLVGENVTGTIPAISNCHIKGIINRISNSACGGMIGVTSNNATTTHTEVSDSTTSVSIIATTQGGPIGGFIGSSGCTDFADCVAGGSINISGTGGGGWYGGFAGIDQAMFYSGESNCLDCSASIAILVSSSTSTGTNYVGGFIGGNIPTNGANPGHGFDCDTCYVAGSIIVLATGTYYIGGFIGNMVDCTIDQCAATVVISAINATVLAAGGFVGYGVDTGATTQLIQNCYSRGSVCIDGVSDADGEIGGFGGKQSANATQAYFTNCYSIGEINIDSVKAGGFLGSRLNGTITACYFDNEISGTTIEVGEGVSTGITGATTANMKLEATYSGWDFDAIWDIPTYTQPAISRSNLTVWLSESGDYDNFEAGVKDADSFSLEIPSGNEIKWIAAIEALFVGTSGDEWKVGSNELDTPITPTNFTVKQQSNYGSKYIQPAKVNEQILFVDFVGRKIRELTYSDSVQKFVAPDLTALAEHITSSGIVCIAHQRNPDSILWAGLDNGFWRSMTYEREQDVVAWSKHPIDGTVQSGCIIPATNEDEIWISVRRNINDTIRYEDEIVTYEGENVTLDNFVTYIEKMMPRDFGTDIADAFFVDSGITVENDPASATVAGLDHLEGESVVGLADGVVFDEAVVSEDGEITIEIDGVETTASKIQVGLAYTYKLSPMRPDISGPAGTTHGSIIKVPEMGISFLNTMNAQYGVSDDDLFDIDWTNTQWTNNTEIDDLFTGDVVVSVDGGFSIDNPLIISGSDPMPCTVRALIPRMEKTGR